MRGLAVPIPGSEHVKRPEQRVAATNLGQSAAEVIALDPVFHCGAVAGARYSENLMKLVQLAS